MKSFFQLKFKKRKKGPERMNSPQAGLPVAATAKESTATRVTTALLLALTAVIAVYSLGLFSVMPTSVEDYTDAGGGTYSGGIFADKYSGEGTLTQEDGALYAGSFRQDLYSGRGELALPSGIVYSGDFADGVPNGEGEFSFGGNTYSGGVTAGIISGQGIFTSTEGWSLSGQWFAGHFVFGRLTIPGGSYYEGTFSGGYADGFGIYVKLDDNGGILWRYDGEFSDGARTGYGVMTSLSSNGDEISYQGRWYQNCFLREGIDVS
jgi:hypothetical protein